MPVVNKQAVAQAFGRAAAHYNHHAALQRLSGQALAKQARRTTHLQVLDAGCGTGWFSQHWQQAGNHVTALDLSTDMLQQAQSQQTATVYSQGDIEALPFGDGQFDLSWSNLAVQWCSDLQQALRELHRVTRRGGQVLFSTLEAGSLPELSFAWQALSRTPPVNRFLTREAIQQAGKGLPLRLSSQTLTLGFPDVLSALRSLKGIGATHLHQGRREGMLSRRHLHTLAQHWPQDARGYLLSYHLIYGVMDCD